MFIKDLQEKRNKLVADAQKLVLGENFDSEKRAQADAMLAESDVISADIARLQKIAEVEAEQRSVRPARGPIETSDANMDSAKRELRDFLVTGKTVEKRDLGVGAVAGSITGGSQLVAPAFYPVLTAAQLAYGGLVNIVNQRTTDTGASMKIGFVNDTTSGLQVWGEDTAATELDPALSTATSNTTKYNTGLVLVTLEELQDSYFDVEAFLRDLIGQRLYRGLAKYASQGSSDGSYVSFWSSAVSGATSASPTAIGYLDVLGLYGSIDPAYLSNSTFVMNSSTRTALLGVEDSTGRPLFQPALSAPNGADALGTLLGRPVVLDQYAPSIAATHTALAFGDFKSFYTMRNVGQFEIARDPYTYLVSKGAVGFIGYGRGGSFITDAGTHPVKVLTQHA
jgi:HK97 family phage major capsid protein